MASDACEARGLEVAALTEETQRAFGAFLPPEASYRNPVDMIASATPESFEKAVRLLANVPGIDALIVLYEPQNGVTEASQEEEYKRLVELYARRVELAGSESRAGESGAAGTRAGPSGAAAGSRSGGDRVYAGTVVLAAGVWAPPLLRTIGVSLPIETELHRVAVLAHGPGHGTPVACIDSVTQTYFRPEAGGAMTLVGAFAGQRGWDPDAAAAAADEDLAPLVQAAARRIPALEDAGIVRGVTGVYDMTPDARPLLGRLPGLDGLIVAAGFSGMGFKIAPAVGEGIVGLIAGAPAGSVDLAPFRPDRLGEGRPIEPPNPYSDD